jgi:hypothetical protein
MKIIDKLNHLFINHLFTDWKTKASSLLLDSFGAAGEAFDGFQWQKNGHRAV